MRTCLLLATSDLTSQPAHHSHFVHVACLGMSLGMGQVVVGGCLGHLQLGLWAQHSCDPMAQSLDQYNS